MEKNKEELKSKVTQAYAEHYLLRNRAYAVTIPLTTILSFICLLLCEAFFHDPSQDIFRDYIEIFAVMLNTTLSGFMAGALVVLAFFSVQAVTVTGFLFRTFVLLIAALIANLPIVNLWKIELKMVTIQ